MISIWWKSLPMISRPFAGSWITANTSTQQSKKHSKGQAHHTRTKEIRLRPKTGDHDIEFKVKQASQFLRHKDKVQISVVFRGREIAHIEEGKRVMQEVVPEARFRQGGDTSDP